MLKDLWNVPNVVSLIRLALVPVFIWLVATDEYGWDVALVRLALAEAGTGGPCAG